MQICDRNAIHPSSDYIRLSLSFSDSIRRRCSVMQWNPDVATQLIVASDEDSSPTLRVMLLVYFLGMNVSISN